MEKPVFVTITGRNKLITNFFDTGWYHFIATFGKLLLLTRKLPFQVVHQKGKAQLISARSDFFMTF